MNQSPWMSYLLDRLKEPSTWQGLVLLATGMGAHVTPEAAGTIVTTGLAMSGLVGAVTADRPRT